MKISCPFEKKGGTFTDVYGAYEPRLLCHMDRISWGWGVVFNVLTAAAAAQAKQEEEGQEDEEEEEEEEEGQEDEEE